VTETTLHLATRSPESACPQHDEALAVRHDGVRGTGEARIVEWTRPRKASGAFRLRSNLHARFGDSLGRLALCPRLLICSQGEGCARTLDTLCGLFGEPIRIGAKERVVILQGDDDGPERVVVA
jgi:hypothetical protein